MRWSGGRGNASDSRGDVGVWLKRVHCGRRRSGRVKAKENVGADGANCDKAAAGRSDKVEMSASLR